MFTIASKMGYVFRARPIANDKYLNLLSRGGLTVPSANLADFAGSCFAVFDFVGEHMQKHQIIIVREVSIINVFFNKKEKIVRY